MCGIFGFVAAEGRALDARAVEGMLAELFVLSEPRGKEASGLVFAAAHTASVHKRPMPPTEMLRTPEYRSFLAEQLSHLHVVDGKLAAPIAAMGHCRLVTNGGQTQAENNQPIVGQRTIGIHNGIVVNHGELWRDLDAAAPTPESDTVVVVRLIDEEADRTGDIAVAVQRAFHRLQGTASVAILRADAGALVLATNIGSLYVADLGGFVVFTSERYSLTSFLAGRGLPTDAVRHLAPHEAAVVEFATGRLTPFRLDAAAPPAVPSRPNALILRDMAPPIRALRRCSRCILPSTYPFIDFAWV